MTLYPRHKPMPVFGTRDSSGIQESTPFKRRGKFSDSNCNTRIDCYLEDIGARTSPVCQQTRIAVCKPASGGFRRMIKASLHNTWNFKQCSMVTFSTAACNSVNRTLIRRVVASLET